MPTYEYACKSCGERLEVHQKFTDDALTDCPTCSGALRKVFGNVGIAFKGSGFYKTDSRSTPKTSSTSTSSGDSGSSSESSPSSTSSDSAPASKPTPTTTPASTPTKTDSSSAAAS